MVPRLLVDVDFGIISISGSSAAIKAVGVSDSWNNNIIKIFLRAIPSELSFLLVKYCLEEQEDFCSVSDLDPGP